MGSTPALRGQQSFESGASTETARPDAPSRNDSAATAKDGHGRNRASTTGGTPLVPQRTIPLGEAAILLGTVVSSTSKTGSRGAPNLGKSPLSPASVAPPLPAEEQRFSPHVLDVFFSRAGDSAVDFGSDPRFLVPDSTVARTRTPSGQAPLGSPSPPAPAAQLSLPLSFQGNHPIRAATIERWVAELGTSVSPGRWLDLFLVYRAFISPLSLSRLLMVQFEWGCRVEQTDGAELKYAKELMVSRTFHGLKMWLTGFFEVDWTGEAQMRNEFAGWLNVLSVQKRQDCFTPVARVSRPILLCRRFRMNSADEYHFVPCH